MDILARLYPFYFFVLFLSLLIVLLFSLKSSLGLFRRISSKEYLVLAVMVFLGLVLRIKGTAHIDLDPYGWRYIQDALTIQKHFLVSSYAASALEKAVHVPGYSFLIAAPLLFWKSPAAVSLLNVVFSALTVGIVYGIARLATRSRPASLLAAAFLAFSQTHIFYSGFEFPMSLSIFFVALAFLCLLLWLENQDALMGWVFIFLFLVSINIKIENLLFGLFFLPVFFYQAQKKGKAGFRYLGYFASLFLVTLLFVAPFAANQAVVQQRLLMQAPGAALSLGHFFDNLGIFIIGRLHAFPLWILAGYALLWFFRNPRTFEKADLVFGWLLVSLASLFYYIPINTEWNLLQILVPAYILGGYVMVESLRLIIAKQRIVNGLLAALVVLLLIRAGRATGYPRPYSWQDLGKDLGSAGDTEEIVSLDVRTSSFALPFLFPQKKWVFLKDRDAGCVLARTRDGVYFFNPVPYGLSEEAALEKTGSAADVLKESGRLARVSGAIELYRFVAAGEKRP